MVHYIQLTDPKTALTPILDPHALSSEATAQLQAALSHLYAKNTHKAYEHSARYWAAWYELRYGGSISFPIPVTVIVQFVLDHVEQQTKDGLTTSMPETIRDALKQQKLLAETNQNSIATVSRHLAFIGRVHTDKSLTNPCKEPLIRDLMQSIRRSYAQQGKVTKTAAALDADLLNKLIQTCDDSLLGLRDRALLLFAFATGGRRRSEVVNARYHQLQLQGNGDFLFTIGITKTDQSLKSNDESRIKPVAGAAAEAMRIWLEKSEIKEGALFRNVTKSGKVGTSLSAQSVRLIVKKRCLQAGIDPSSFTAHSLRSGFITESGKQGNSLFQTMQFSGHRSVAMANHYFRSKTAIGTPEANVFDTAIQKNKKS